jgi:hypothetical protein
MKSKNNYGLEKGAKDRGFNEGTYHENGENAVDDSPKNSQWKDLDDGGFLNRNKGQER